jgi:hypothetical protein
MPGAGGHTVIGRSPGVIAAALPAYALFRSAHMTLVPGGYTAALLTAAAVTLLFLALARETTRKRALLGALAFAFTTPVWSIAANAMWPHTLTVLGIAGMAWASSTRRYWLMGVFGGIALWGRLQAALIVAVAALLLGIRRRDPWIVLKSGSVAAAFLAASCVWIHWMNGTWNPLGYQSHGTAAVTSVGKNMWGVWLVGNELGLWVSPDRGILVWTPVLLLLLPGMVRSWRTLPDWSKALVWSGLVYTLVQGKINSFSGGDPFYGYRLGLELLACVTPAAVLSTRRMGPVVRHALAPLLVAQLWVISLGAVSNGYFVVVYNAWRDNAFLVAVRQHPAAILGMLVLLVVTTVVVQELWFRRAARGEPAENPTDDPDQVVDGVEELPRPTIEV